MSFLRRVVANRSPLVRASARLLRTLPLAPSRIGSRASARWFSTEKPTGDASKASSNADVNKEDELKAAMDWIKANSGDVKMEFSDTTAPPQNLASVGDESPAAGTQTVDATATTEEVGAPPVSRPYTMPPKETKEMPTGTEAKKGTTRSYDFKAETRQILDIMANSLYTDKEVFLRELISNASDALEKFRYLQQSSAYKGTDEQALEIHIVLDNVKKTLTVQDFGIGMTADELVSNLGTIARSGSKAYKELAAKSGGTQSATASNIIGQFGVGFYSVFMVANRVEVFSKSAAHPEQPAHYWTSDGSGNFEMGEAEGVSRGTKVVVHLKDNYDCKAFAQRHVVETIIKKYSNFVGSPIYLNGTKMNTFSAIWAADKSKVTEAEHKEFYRFIANAYDDPYYRLQFQTDVPLNINALFYFPERHMEKFGMGRSDPGVNVYSRKVLIQSKSKVILPEWLRFVKGVVDSEDIPLNISRENMQDSALIARINTVLTKRIIKFLDETARKEPAKYNKFFKEFGQFIKEGVCNDFANKDDIARLLRFDTSLGDPVPQSLDEYVSRMPPEQKAIYYLNAPSRAYALASPYYESFAKKRIEVLFLYQHIDDFVMKNMEQFNKRRLVSIESANLDGVTEEKSAAASSAESEQAMVDLFKSVLADRVSSVKATTRLVSSPAIVVDHESAAVRRVMRFVDSTGEAPISKQKLEINPSHPMLIKLAAVRTANPDLAKIIVEQVFDNALIAADILDNPRSMLSRLNRIMDASLAPSAAAASSSKVAAAATEAPKPASASTSADPMASLAAEVEAATKRAAGPSN